MLTQMCVEGKVGSGTKFTEYTKLYPFFFKDFLYLYEAIHFLQQMLLWSLAGGGSSPLINCRPIDPRRGECSAAVLSICIGLCVCILRWGFGIFCICIGISICILIFIGILHLRFKICFGHNLYVSTSILTCIYIIRNAHWTNQFFFEWYDHLHLINQSIIPDRTSESPNIIQMKFPVVVKKSPWLGVDRIWIIECGVLPTLHTEKQDWTWIKEYYSEKLPKYH